MLTKYSLARVVVLVPLLSLCVFGYEKIDMAKWDNPVYFTTNIRIHDDLISVFDSKEWKLKLYDVSKGLESPTLLWETAGAGPGPNEIPKDTKVNNVAVDLNHSEVWMSHQYGFKVYDLHSGVQKRNTVMPFNAAWVEISAGSVFITSEKPFQKRVVLQELKGTLDPKVDDLSPFIVSSIEHPTGIPVTDSGAFLNLRPELFFLNGKFYAWEFIIGELCIIENNQITAFERIPQHHYLSKRMKPVSYDGIANQPSMQVMGIPFPECGMVYSEGTIWTSLFCPRDPYPLRAFVQLDENGKIVGKYTHQLFKDFESIFRCYLLSLEDHTFIVFDAVEGDTIYKIPKRELIKL